MSTTKYLALFAAVFLVLPYATIPLQAYGATSHSGFTVSVTDGKKNVNAGGSLIYAVSVYNNGNDQDTTNVQLDLPDYTTLVSPSDGGELRNGKVYWSNITMSPNSSMTMTVQVTLVPQIPSGTVLTAVASAGSSSSKDTTIVGAGAIPKTAFKLSVTDGLSTVSPTQNVTYTATVKNVSSSEETADIHLSVGQFVVVTDVDADAYVDGNSLTWYNVTLAPGSSVTYKVSGKIDRWAAEYYLITTKLQVAGMTSTDVTSVQTNAKDLMGNDVQSNSKIRFSVTPDQQEVLPGGSIRYTVYVRNGSSQAIDGLTATVKFDPSISILTSAGTATKINASTLQWNVPKLNAGETWTTSFELALVDGLPAGTAIPVISTLKGSSIDSITLQSRVSVTSVALIGSMPTTGAGMDTIAALLLIPMAMLAAGFQRRLSLI